MTEYFESKYIPDTELQWMIPILIELRQLKIIACVWLETNYLFINPAGAAMDRDTAIWYSREEAKELCQKLKRPAGVEKPAGLEESTAMS